MDDFYWIRLYCAPQSVDFAATARANNDSEKVDGEEDPHWLYIQCLQPANPLEFLYLLASLKEEDEIEEIEKNVEEEVDKRCSPGIREDRLLCRQRSIGFQTERKARSPRKERKISSTSARAVYATDASTTSLIERTGTTDVATAASLASPASYSSSEKVISQRTETPSSSLLSLNRIRCRKPATTPPSGVLGSPMMAGSPRTAVSPSKKDHHHYHHYPNSTSNPSPTVSSKKPSRSRNERGKTSWNSNTRL